MALQFGQHSWNDQQTFLNKATFSTLLQHGATSITATGTDAASAAVITTDFVSVNSATGGLRLPAATFGMSISVLKAAFADVTYYPAAGDRFFNHAADVSVHPSASADLIVFYCYQNGRWFIARLPVALSTNDNAIVPTIQEGAIFGNQISPGGNSIFGVGNLTFGNGTLSNIRSPSDGVIELTNNAITDFGRLQFGGTTSAFPSLKRSAAALDARLADDSAFALVRVATPVAAQDAATKNYVDTAVSGSSSPPALKVLLAQNFGGF